MKSLFSIVSYRVLPFSMYLTRTRLILFNHVLSCPALQHVSNKDKAYPVQSCPIVSCPSACIQQGQGLSCSIMSYRVLPFSMYLTRTRLILFNHVLSCPALQHVSNKDKAYPVQSCPIVSCPSACIQQGQGLSCSIMSYRVLPFSMYLTRTRLILFNHVLSCPALQHVSNKDKAYPVQSCPIVSCPSVLIEIRGLAFVRSFSQRSINYCFKMFPMVSTHLRLLESLHALLYDIYHIEANVVQCMLFLLSVHYFFIEKNGQSVYFQNTITTVIIFFILRPCNKLSQHRAIQRSSIPQFIDY